MRIETMMQITDMSYRTRRTIERSLREIDRKALNAMILVKRHGRELAGYGVVAHAFREQAARLKDAALPLQRAIAPLIRAQMRILQHRRNAQMLDRAARALGKESSRRLENRKDGGWQDTIAQGEAEAKAILRTLVQTVARLQDGIAEQEYVVTIGSIEAALSEASGTPLMRVSQEMRVAVTTVQEAIWKYRNLLEEVMHESNTGI